MPGLAVEDIHTYYGESHVLHGVSLAVAPGEAVALLGRNGAGKTTVIRSIVGFTPPRRGRVVWEDAAIEGWPPARIARRGIVPPLARAGITPNQVTTVRLLVGLSAAACFAAGTFTWRLAGAVLFVVSFVLDRADGDLARATGHTSPAGHTYDLISDTVCNALAFVGLGLGLTDSSLGSWAVPLGLLAGGGVVAVLLLVMRIERLQGARAAELKDLSRLPDVLDEVVPVATV